MKQLFYHCNCCYGIFKDKGFLLSKELEFNHYKNHNNEPNDEGYQKFVAPVVSSVFKDFNPGHSGLDYGAGSGSAIFKLLNDQNFQIEQYDPFFYNFKELLAKKYHYIVCCEVIEHFHHPYHEFSGLKKMLLNEGKLYCMTDVYHSGIDFGKWYYKNDPTHVFIYQKKTFEWIKTEFGFTGVDINGRKITFYNQGQ